MSPMRTGRSSPPSFVPEQDGGHLLREWRRLGNLSPSLDLQLLHREFVDTMKAHAYEQMYRTVFAHDIRPALDGLRCPVLILAGTRDVLYAGQAAAAARIPGAQLVEIPDGGTFMMSEAPTTVSRPILEFLG